MSCYLRVFGKDFDIDAFLVHIPEHWSERDLEIYRKGTLINEKWPKRGVRDWNGFAITASYADMEDFEEQLSDVIELLEQDLEAFKQIQHFNFEHAIIDFGIERRMTYNWRFESTYLPPQLISLAARCNLSIEISKYRGSQRRARAIEKEGQLSRRKFWRK